MSKMPTKAQWSEVKYNITRLGGGVNNSGVSFPGGFDQTTPSLALQPGALRDVLNFECSQSGGYGRIAGYERFDGHASPSAAIYQIVQVVLFVNVPSAGQVITQATSGATGKIVGVNNVLNACYMAVSQVTGVFDTTHSITTPGPVTIGTATSPTVSISPLLNAQYLAGAADIYRALINPVPGSGPILGVVAMTIGGVDSVFAFRNNAGATAAALYKASASGWTLVPMLNTVDFAAGGAAGLGPLDGAVLTQGAVTATINRVEWQTGAWSGSSATGTFVITNPAGGNFGAGAATVTGGFTVTLSGIQTAIVLQPNGKYEFVKCNFKGQLESKRIFGVDGVNKLFEFDGVTLSPIKTGLSPDTPNHIAFHKNFLFISLASSIFYCESGAPFKWATGGEIATGDTVNGMITLPGSQTSATLAVLMSGNTAFLYGIDPTTFNFVLFNAGTGAIAFSLQNLFDTCLFDHLGVVTLKTTQNYGNFLPNMLTKNILPFILQERAKLTTSSISRDKGQYRVYFSDGYGLWLTLVNQQYLGAGVVQFPNPVYCCDEDDKSTIGEVTYFGSNDGLGYIYQLDMGTSFDGGNIDARIALAWDTIKSPRIRKRFRAASIEMQGTAYASIQFGYQLSYGAMTVAQPLSIAYPSGFSPAPNWDSFTWDNFIWDGQTLAPTDVDMVGTAENVQVVITSTTNYIAPYNINSVIYHYSMRRGMRV